MSEPFSFVAYGTPQPQGSARAFVRGNRAYVTSANPKMKPYRHTLTQVATEVLEKANCVGPAFPRPLAVELSVVWYLAKPKSTPKKITKPTKKPDTDKLLRAVLDSLTGVVYEDDSQVVRVTAEKRYGSPERTEVTAEEIYEENNSN
jgi:Holliday junction resolvase RusA-like endonuclease